VQKKKSATYLFLSSGRGSEVGSCRVDRLCAATPRLPRIRQCIPTGLDAQLLAVLLAPCMQHCRASPIKWTHTCWRLTRTCACFRVNDRMIAVIVLPHNTRALTCTSRTHTLTIVHAHTFTFVHTVYPRTYTCTHIHVHTRTFILVHMRTHAHICGTYMSIP
jgi:hypothetical protein